MEPAKRPRLNTYANLSNAIEQTGDIFRLNDDCFDEIFCWLFAEDLSTFSETCKHIKNLVKIYFCRKYGQKRSEIARLNGIITIRKYAALNEVIPNIWFRGKLKKRRTRFFRLWEDKMTNDDDDINLLQYYLYGKCNKQPKYIRFENMALLDKEGELLDAVLKHVEAIDFENCEVKNIYNDILARCPNLKMLTIQRLRCTSMDEEIEVENWLTQRYPALESLALQLSTTSTHNMLDQFFELNPHIKRFTCKSRLSSLQSKIQNVMRAIIQNALQLEELFLTIGGKCVFMEIFRQLMDVCDRHPFKRLRLEFGGIDVKDILIDNLNNLASLNKLHALHITNVDFAKDLPNNIDVLASLKELHLNNLANCEYSAKIMSLVTPNLELLIVRNSCYFTPSVVDFIQPFIANLPKLNKIVLAHDVWPRINHRLAFLNEKRQQLSNACTVFIWLYPPTGILKDKPIIVGKTLIRLMKLVDEYEHF